MLELVTAVLIVLCASGLSSGTEAALFSVPLVKVKQLVQANKPSARVLLSIRQNMSRPIASIVVLNNIANIVGSILVGRIAAAQLGSELLGAFSAVLTLLVIIFAEIIPKTLGERYAETIALKVARPVQGITFVLTPLVWTIERLTYPITKGQAAAPTTNEAEIKLLARIGRQEGIIEADESEMIQRVFRLNDVTAGDMMTPRVAMTYVRGNSTLKEAKDVIIASTHSRIIVTGEAIDDILGIAMKNALLTAIIEDKAELPVSALVDEALFVPENVRGDKLLQIFQKNYRHLAVVIDEFGGVAGVVTLEDVLETLTGEIVDETDIIADLQAEARRRNKSLLGKPLSSAE